jgi:hypothetical protein
MWQGDLLKAGIASDGTNIDIAGNLSVLGIPVVGTTFGNAYFVDYRNGADTNNGKTKSTSFKTLSAAVAAVTTNNNDVIYIDGDSEVVETAMISLSKNRVHIVGCNGPTGHFGPGARVSLGVTTVATDLGVLQNTGVRNTFSGIKFSSSNTKAESLYSVVEAGEYARYFNCEFYKSTDLDVTGAAELVANGDSSMFYNCTIGSSANAISGAIVRANVLFTNGIVAGKVARDNWFEGCILWRRSSNVANRFVYGANAADIQRFCVFKSCFFGNAKNASAVPAQNVAFGSSLTVGEVLLWDCVALNAATAMSTTTGVFVQGYTPDATGAAAGIAIQAA